jgi:hypothetical protein
LVSLNLFGALGLAFLALLLLDGTYLFGCLELSMLALLLDNVGGRADARSFGKLLLELSHLGGIL